MTFCIKVAGNWKSMKIKSFLCLIQEKSVVWIHFYKQFISSCVQRQECIMGKSLQLQYLTILMCRICHVYYLEVGWVNMHMHMH